MAKTSAVQKFKKNKLVKEYAKKDGFKKDY